MNNKKMSLLNKLDIVNKAKLAQMLTTVFIIIIFLYLVVWCQFYKKISAGRNDFIIFYTAGKMITSGYGEDLYVLSKQTQMQQQQMKSHVFKDGVLPYNHPPFESAVFCGISYLSFICAYWVWTLFSIFFAILSLLTVLNFSGYTQMQPWLIQILLAMFSFFPVFVTLIQGQDSLFLLFFLILSFKLMKQGKEFYSGVILAFSLFKFHLILPLYLLILIKKKWRIIGGSFCSGFLLLLLSYLLVGKKGIVDYFRLLIEMVYWNDKYNVNPLQMRNIRGMLALLAGNNFYVVTWGSLIIGLIVLIMVLKAWKGVWKKDNECFDMQFSLAILSGLIVGYHLYSHDQAILVLPFLVLLQLAQKGNTKYKIIAFGLLGIANLVMIIPVVKIFGLFISLNALYLIAVFYFIFHTLIWEFNIKRSCDCQSS